MTGFDREASKELVGSRGTRQRVYRNADGTFTTRYYNEPVNFRRTDGSWQAIDTTLIRAGGGGRLGRSVAADPAAGWTTVSGEASVTLGSFGDDRPLAALGVDGDRSVAFSLENAAHVAGAVDGDTITYADVRPSADVQFEAGSTSIKEMLVLKDRDAPTEWVFPLTLRGLTARVEDSGAVALVDVTGGTYARIPAGWMEDSRVSPNSNEGAVSSGVQYSLVTIDGGPALKVSLDKQWLQDPDRMYPVRVDPSVQKVTATSGTYVESPYNQDFSSDTVLKVGTYDAGGHKAAAFLRFSGLETTLKNAYVLSANLALYNTWSYSCTARPVSVYPITQNWSESTTEKYPGPSTGSSLGSKSFAHGWRPEGTETWSCDRAWETIKLGSAGRKLVDDWTHGRVKNYGLAVKASTSDSRGWKEFGSDDNSNKPSLDVTWTSYGSTYKLGDWVTPVTSTAEGKMKVTVTNRGQATWPKAGAYKLRYRLYNAAGTEITSSSNVLTTDMPQDVSPGEAVTIDARIAKLTPATYTLAWTMAEGSSLFTDSGVPGLAMQFSSVNIPPQLTGESPVSGVVEDSLTPTLWATGKDTDRYPFSTLQYSFEVCEVQGKDTRKNCRTGTRSTAKQWAVPEGWLSWGKTYAWYAYVYDGNATSARPGPALFTTQVPQPAVTSHLGSADAGREFGARSGNYITAATDASVAVVGPELAVSRTYNSLDPRTGNAFGVGWSTPWDMRLYNEFGAGTVLVTFGDGSQARFGENADGSYTGPAGYAGTLKDAVQGWDLRDGKGWLYHFMETGRLTTVTDAAGRRQSLRYQQEDGGPLTRVTDETSGRTLTFTWSGNHVESVTTSAVGPVAPGLTWTYHYDGDRLTTVCPPDSTTACTRYTYDDGSRYRSAVLDANAVSYWRLGETEGSVATSEAPSRTGLNQATYRDVVLGSEPAVAGTADTAATFDGTDSYVELPDDTISTSTYLSVELWFKTTSPGVLVGFQESPLEDGTPVHWTPALGVDSAGKLRGEFWNGSVAPITSTTSVTDGVWHHAALTGAGTTQTLYLDGEAIGTRTGPIDHQDMTYTYLGAGYSSPGWDGQTAGVRHFTGSMDEVAVYHYPLDPATVAEHFAARQATGLMTAVTLPSGRTHAQVAYDTATGRVTQTTDENGGTWHISAPAYSSGSATYTTAVTKSDPQGYWRLGEQHGATAATALPEGVDASYGDAVTLGRAGAFADGDDAAATFDGTSDSYVELPNDILEGTTTPSVELWFRTSKSGVLMALQNAELGQTPTAYRPVLNVDAAGKLRGELWVSGAAGATPITSTTTVTDNEWHHVVLAGATSTQSLYLDGTKVGSLSGTIIDQSLPHAFVGGGYASPSWYGASTSGTYYFTGQIDEPAVYDHTLDGATVTAHYRARTDLISGDAPAYRGSVKSDAPGAYWRLDETSGTTAASDVKANNGNGTYTRVTLGTTGAFGVGEGGAAQFNGNSYAQLPGAIMHASTNLAVELWFRTTKPGVMIGDQSRQIEDPAGIGGSWTPVLYVGADNKLHGKFFVNSTVTGTSVASTDTVTDNQWHHAVISASGTTQTLYLDGVPQGTLTGAVNHQANSLTYIGAGYAKNWPGSPSDISYFNGAIDEVSIFQHPLTGDQVAEHYRARSQTGVSALASTVTVTDPLGRTTSSTYDALRGERRLSDTDADGGVTTYTYDTGGFLHTVTDPNGHATITGHDARGNVVSQTTCRDSNSCWTSFTEYYLNPADPLDPRNDKPTGIRDARSSGPADARYLTRQTYTSGGLPDTTTLVDGRTRRVTYTDGTEQAVGGGSTPIGLVKTQTTTGRAVTTSEYYANGDLARVTSPSSLVTTFTYDGIGRRLTETQISDSQPAGVTSTYGYNAMSQVVSETGPGVKNEITNTTHTARITRLFDADGNLLSETAQDSTGGDTSRTTAYHYDEHGLTDSVTDAEEAATTYEHDPLGRVSAQTDPAGTTTAFNYTRRGQLATSTLKNWTGDPSGQIRDLVLESRSYDPAGRLASVTDAMGATTAYTYYDDDLQATVTAKSVTQADGTHHDVVREASTYDGAGQLIQQVTGGGKTTTNYTVDATGRTTRAVLDPAGLNRITTYAYDDDDRVKEQVTQKGTTTGFTVMAFEPWFESDYTYDAAGNVLTESVSDGLGSSPLVRHTYDQRGLLTSTISGRGNTSGATAADYTTNYRHDALGRLVEQTAPPVSTETGGNPAQITRPATLTGYNTFGEATETRDPNGNTTRATVDRLGRPTTTTLPEYTPPGSSTSLTATSTTQYDVLGRAVLTSDPLGRTTAYAYDQLGNLTAQSLPIANPSGLLPGVIPDPANHYTWTPTGLQLSATSTTGARTEATYDELGRQLTATTVERYPTAQNLTSRYAWDDADNQTASAPPSGHFTTATFNAAGEPVTVTDPLSRTTRMDYDVVGHMVRLTRPLGDSTFISYNEFDQPTGVTDFGSGSGFRDASAEYDDDGNRISVTDATRATTEFTYDALGRLTQQVEPVSDSDADSIVTGFGYDAVGNRTSLTDGRQNKSIYTYNSWNLPESVIEPSTPAHPAAAARTWTTTYDKAGQAVTLAEPNNVIRQRTYDVQGRLTKETGVGSSQPTADRILGYDTDDRLTTVGTTNPINPNTYTYNDRGQLLSTAGPGGQSAYAYDIDGKMTSRQDAAGTTAYGYYADDTLKTATDPLTGTTVGYTYDDNGRTKSEQYGTGGTRTYGYDEFGRLATDKITTPTGGTTASITYGYDLADRLTTKTTTGTAGAAANSYTYDHAGRMTSWTSGSVTTAYEWDKSGNRTKVGGVTSTYDARNRLTSDGTSTYTYTGRGTLSGVTTNGVTRTVGFDSFDRLMLDGTTTYRYDALDRAMASGAATFTYDGGSTNLVGDGTSVYTRTPDGTLLGTSNGTSGQLAITDQHTDLVATLNPTGDTLTGSTAYDPFGKEISAAGTTPSVGYQSGWTDPANGNVNMAARWYQPGTGTFTSRDDWLLDPSPSSQANRYLYANASPMNGIDPSGHKEVATGSGGGGVLYAGGQPIYTGGAGGVRGGSFGGIRGSNAGKGLLGVSGVLAAGYAINSTINYFTQSTAPTASSASTSTSIGRSCAYYGFSCNMTHGSGPFGHSGATGHSVGVAAGTSAAVTAAVQQAIRIIPQNPKGPGTKVSRGPVRADWDPWKPTPDDIHNIVQAVFSADYLSSLAQADVPAYSPVNVSNSVRNAASAVAAGLTTAAVCILSGSCVPPPEDEPSTCAVNGKGWVDYQDTDPSHGNRARGVTACLTNQYLDNNPGTDTEKSIRPPGYGWARRYASYHHATARSSVNNCHLLGAQIGGSGTDLRNLSTCGRDANTFPERGGLGAMDNMVQFETQVHDQVRAGNTVLYTVRPRYLGDRIVPQEYVMAATSWDKKGNLVGTVTRQVRNMMNTPQGWHNLGTVVHTRTGADIPTSVTD
ncbi:LamG domain-containing protein [Streptomyces sp. PA03-5A]|nr:LamG domain-containing protein [Streptomyces sp. PA03-5A]